MVREIQKAKFFGYPGKNNISEIKSIIDLGLTVAIQFIIIMLIVPLIVITDSLIA